jgi:hypothetical protein
MSKLSEIVPTNSPRMIDLVEAAGVDISDWGNFKGGKKKAASNPKYCFEWSFVEPKKVVVLNLWHDFMEENDDGARHAGMVQRPAWKSPNPCRTNSSPGRPLISSSVVMAKLSDGGAKHSRINGSFSAHQVTRF